MRLTTLFLLCGLLQVSAGTYGQQVSLNQERMTIKEVFKEIKRQTGYDVLWQGEKLDTRREISARFQGAALAQVMRACLQGQNLDFFVQDQSIVIKEVAERLVLPNLIVRQDSVIYRGRIVDEHGKAMAGATVKVQSGNRQTFTTAQGNFSIYGPRKGALVVSYLGYLTREVTLSGLDPKQPIQVSMVPGTNNLGEVNVVSTGYQDLPKERATGSFEVITKEQLQHSTDPNLLRRLEGITTSMNFNNQLVSSNSSSNASIDAPSPLNNLTIRGKNTLTSVNNNPTGIPLVVIDGIASPYSIDLINPNDVESITILKDAAAASIWGSRAANGVIVVKTKRGSYERPVVVSFNANFNVTEKLDLFYNRLMSTSDFIDAEIIRFNANNTSITTPVLNRPQRNISPVDEILWRQKSGQIAANQATAELDVLRKNDIRRDFTDYFLRNSFRQSYAMGISGGSKYVAYRLSMGYDKNLNNTNNSDGNRATLGYSASVRPIKNLELTGSINYVRQRTNNQAPNNRISGITNPTFYPYTRLVDDQQNPLSIPKSYRPAWVDLFEASYGSKVLSLRYVPLEDINQGYYRTNNQNLNMGLNAAYQLNKDFSVNLAYNYSVGRNEGKIFYTQNSFYMRDLINLYTNPTSFVRNLPLGGQLQTNLGEPENQTLRGQLNFNRAWKDKHVLSAIAGMDVSEGKNVTTSNAYYGYNEDLLSSNVNLAYNASINPLLYTTSSGLTFANLPALPTPFASLKSRTISTYSNAAYTYDRRYTISGSIRRDQSSEFGMGSNKGGTPFWSTGVSWSLPNEEFYHWALVPRLQLRATYGYNGNVNPSVSSYPLIFYNDFPASNGLLYAYPIESAGATNLQLRPEKTGVLNLGLDFGFRNNRISGSIEYYDKRTTDLLSQGPVDPSTGYNLLTYNTGDIHGWGTDFTLTSLNLRGRKFSWTSSFLFSYNRVKLTKLYSAGAQSAGNVIVSTGTAAYNVGYDLSRLFAYRWAGLDPVTGDPRGYLNGQVVSISNTASGSNNFTAINNAPLSTARYFGSAVPVYYGSIRNSFSYGRLSVSANLLYKLGYYFRRPLITGSVRYTALFSDRSLQGDEYGQRWQQLGDERLTNVPSLTLPASTSRDNFYGFSEINVEKGDHIRLQEVNFSYGFDRKSSFIKNARLYLNISNLGVIWRANKLGIDPDTFDYPIPRIYSFGFSTNL